MKRHIGKSLLSLMLAVVLCLQLVVPAAAMGVSDKPAVTVEKVDNSAVSAVVSDREPVELKENENKYAATDVVRVSIVLEKEGTIEAGFGHENIAMNDSAIAYRENLHNEQISVAAAISKATKAELDVVWNLTLAANIISANVKFGDIETILAVKGVKDVLIETRYEPCVVDENGGADPNMATSGKQIGSAAAYLAGYTGAGTRIAVVDTGTDIDHKSFDAAAYEYALGVLAEEAGMDVETYIESLNLLDADELAGVADQLNAASPVYINSKLPFGYNYVDENTNVIHLNDGQGEHGSHVAGIATANSYVSDGDDGFEPALDAVHVQGVAPDAQLLTMKVFGKKGGAYDSDYMAAIEDAIVLNCDAINLSLGSGNPGMSRSATASYQQILDSLVNSGVVLVISAGNSGYWSESAESGLPYLYLDDVSMQTGGSPGSYTNSLSVASVNNDGWTALSYMVVGQKAFLYNETTGYTNQPITTLAGKQEFVFLNEIGEPDQWDALGIDLKGKIAVCYRGTIAFSEKANAAASRGAIGVIIVNNQPGAINMDLSDYLYSAPCVSVTQASGEYFKAVGTAVSGNGVNGWTGTMKIYDGLASGMYNSAYYTMSDFSSWGVPGSLELKPEITAPGGSIYSVAGANVTEGQLMFTDHASYEVMSGTSMAAPQVTGMSALVAQYVRAEGLSEKTGVSVRTLVQSLLMSTAVPMRDAESNGNYYPVIQQGAGLANVGNAVNADSYILMGADATASYADGKVKAELGDDPEKNGVYTFSFTINNLSDVEKSFLLSADVFTQDYFSAYGMDLMDTWTAPLAPAITWTVNGEALESAADLTGLDFNGDGISNYADGQTLLDYATGICTELTNAENADFDQDGDVDSNDAYLFLSLINEGSAVVAANGSAEVAVTITLTEADKQMLAAYASGAYIEAYVYAESVATAEGVSGTIHSIPVLGFYGNWSDASMFDKGSYVEYVYGLENRPPYLYESNFAQNMTNTLTVRYGGESAAYNFGGNPIVAEQEYLPERNSISSADGTLLSQLGFAVIRNAADSYLWIKDTATGGYYVLESMGAVTSAYYYVNGGYWVDTYRNVNLNLALTGIPEGTALELGLTLVPEYYLMNGKQLDLEALGEGATFSMPMVVDNTAPTAEVDSAVLNGKSLTLNVKDNRYVAAVAFFDASGANLMSVVSPNQTVEGETVAVTMDLENVVGKTFLMQVYDYAMNVTTYKVSYDLMPDLDAYYMFFDMGKNAWYGYTEDGTEHAVMGYSDKELYAGEYVDGYVFAFDEHNDLYVMPDNDFANMSFVAHAKDDGPLSGEYEFFVSDMAYNPVDGKMYFLAYSDANYLYYPYLYTVDLYTGAVSLVGEMTADTWTLAIDDEGNFYGQDTFANILWKYTLDTYTDPEFVGVLADELSIYMAQSALAWDSKNDKLVFTLCVSSIFGMVQSADIFLIDPVDLSYSKLTPHENLYAMVGTYVRNWEVNPDRFAATTAVDSVILSDAELSLHTSMTATLGVTVLPWNLENRSVVWTSSDESVAVVDANGVVTAVGAGEAVITAASAMDGTKYASCKVNVIAETITLSGMLADEEGNTRFYVWDMEHSESWKATGNFETSLSSATYDVMNNKLYVMDAIKNNWAMHVVNPETGAIENTFSNPMGIPLWDMEYSTVFSTEESPKVTGIYATYLLPMKSPFAMNTSAFNLGSYLATYTGASYLAAVTSAGYYAYEENNGNVLDTEWLIMLDDAGCLWFFWIYDQTGTGSYNAYIGFYDTTLDCKFANDGVNLNTSMIIGQDGNLYVSVFTGKTNEVYRLVLNNETGVFEAARLGDFGEDVWPAVLLNVSENGAGTLNAPVEAIANIAMEEISVKELQTAPFVSEAIAAVGSLNAAPNSSVENTPKVTTTVELTAVNAEGAEVDSHNGVQTVTYDPSIMELVGVTVNGDYFSVNRQTEEGKVTIGYVNMNGIPAGETTATLIFESASTESTTIQVEHKEVNADDKGFTETLEFELVHVCKYVAVVTEPTCTEGGYTTYTCSGCGDSYTDNSTAALGHDWDGLSCTRCDATRENPFLDVLVDQFFFEPVLWAYENGITNGVAEYIFDPNGVTNRAQMVTFLWRAMGCPEPTITENPFVDVSEDYAYKAILWAYENGITTGVDATHFAPNALCSRSQIVTFLWRTLGKPEASAESNPFADVTEADFYYESVLWAYGEGITTGVDEENFAPFADCSRAEAVTFLYRTFGE